MANSKYSRHMFFGTETSIFNGNNRKVFLQFIEITPDVIFVNTQDEFELSSDDSYIEILTLPVEGVYRTLHIQIQLIFDGSVYLLKVIAVK